MKTEQEKKEENRLKQHKWRIKHTSSHKDYYEKNKEDIKSKRKKYNEINIENRSEYNKQWKANNVEKYKDYQQSYRDENKLNKKITMIKWKINNPDYQKNKCLNDPIFKLSKTIRSNLTRIFRDKEIKKNNKTILILGCSFQELKEYLESKFEPWMTWDNRGLYNGELNYGWDIDHIIPLSSAINEEAVIKLNHYSNLQPLCSYTNRYIKKNNY